MKRINIIVILLIILFSNFNLKAQKPQKDSIRIKKLDKIVVQATKTDLSAGNAPLLISVINEQTAENFKVNDLGDLNSRVPNLFMQRHGSRLTSPIYIRGIGSRINSPAVGLYVDGIPYFDMGSFNFEMYDIQRIEVLRGPQGTLYGRNTMGGLINIITLQPVDKQQLSLSTMYGNYNRIKSVLHYNQPLSKKIIMVLDGAYAHSDGFIINKFLNTSANSYNTYSGKLKLQYKANEKLKANFVLSYERSRENGYPYGIYDTTTQTRSHVSYDQLSSYNRNMLSAGLKIKYSADKFILNSMSSYQNLVDTQRIDQDFTTKNLLFVDQNRTHQYFVQELNIKSKINAKIKWIGGLFGFKNLLNKNVDVFYNQDAVALFHLPSLMRKNKTYNQPEEGVAAYGQISLPFKNFDLTAGIRADYEKDNLKYIYNLYMLGNEYKKADVDTFNTYFEILPKISLSYRFSDNVFVYSSISKGYKAGGFNSTFERNEDISFNPEYSYNYETGVKTTMFGQKLRLNASVFYIDWLDQQVYQPVPSGQGAMLKNAGHSMSRGGELEITAFPVRNLKAWLYAGYNDVRYLSYVKDENTDYSGNKIPYIPEYTGNLGFNYTLELNHSFLRTINFSADYQLIGKFYWNDLNTAYQKTYGLLNANIFFNTKHFILGFSGKNLLNANYNAFYFEELGHSYAQEGNPIEFSTFIKIKF